VIVYIFKKLAKAHNNYIYVIKVVLNLLCLNLKIKKGSQKINVIAFNNINVILKLIYVSFDGINKIMIKVLELCLLF
jgi:hypothetical protein